MSDDLDAIFKALRLVPEFDGNPNILTRFIKLCDQIVATYVQAGADLDNLAVINGILNKITGPAARLINSNGIPEDWMGIRKALINNFADQRDETALYNDLSLLTQGSSTPQEFYERCQNLFSTIITYVSLHETIETTVVAKRSLYQKLTLQAFLRGLKDPLGSRIRCMRPETIEKALEYVQEEVNTLYLQQRNEHMSDRKPHPSQQVYRPTDMHPPYSSYNIKPYNMLNLPGPSRPQPPPMWKPQPPPMWRPPQMQFQVNRGPTRTQQMFGAPPPNYNAQNNGFRVTQRGPFINNANPPNTAPKPMSGVSHFVSKPLPPSGHDWRKFGNPPPSNYFKTREMNFNEMYNYDCNPYDSYYSTEYEYYPGYFDCPEQLYDQPQYADIEYPSTSCEISDESPPEQNEGFQKDMKSNKPK